MATLLSLHVTIYIDPANKTAFFEAFKPVFDLVVAEPELIFFEVYQSPDEPGKLSWVENWNASREWLLETQLSKEYYAPYLAITEPMFIKPREVAIYDTVGPPYLVFKKTPEQS
ncbi:hypothetical protein B0T11DRAFT_324460 [Plectosphaerella cucumerina]|uniref:ABM domain-containing protein n=1 Tax=Plectosphaerella cucumerina TaxID=40658 RepID=A0A8K0X932_9PEZI|nr:hypothetical protein B0T11DRAFT_324460 [Plectosphaerella cucumerina]